MPIQLPKIVPNRSIGGLIDNAIGSVTNGTGILGGIAGVVKAGIGDAIGSVLGFPIGSEVTDGLVRLSFKPGHPYASYPGILGPLGQTGGMIFPFRPSIDIQRQVNYESVSPVHGMQDYKSFKNNTAANITITGDYTAQTAEEAQYVQAVIHFIRTASLMAFGQNGAVPIGMPPPVLNLSAYGRNNIVNVPVILTTSIQSYPPDVDYVIVAGNSIPTLMKITVVMDVQLSPAQLRNFSLDAFASGQMQGFV